MISNPLKKLQKSHPEVINEKSDRKMEFLTFIT